MRILERQTFNENEVIDFTLMHEVNPDHSDLEEVEDKNWFDDDNMMAKSGNWSVSDIPEMITTNRAFLRGKGFAGDPVTNDLITILSQASNAKDDSLFKYDCRNRMTASSSSLLCLVSAFLFAGTFGFMIYKAMSVGEFNRHFLEWTNYLISLNQLEVHINSMMVSALKMEAYQSSYFERDSLNQTFNDYMSQYNKSVTKFYDTYIATREFENDKGIISDLPPMTTYHKEQSGLIESFKDSPMIAMKTILSASLAIVLCSYLAIGRT